MRRLASASASPRPTSSDGGQQSPAITPDMGIALLHAYPQPIVDTKIRKQLGFTPRLSLDQTLEGLRRWYRFMGLAR